MRYIDIKLINGSSLITVTKDDTSVLTPAVIEPDTTDTILDLQLINPGLKEFRFITESASNVATIEIQHPSVTGDAQYYPYYFSDFMDEAYKPLPATITFFENLALL
jgi:hypothetical protein